MIIKDLKGKRFGRLLVKGLDIRLPKPSRARWICQCDCGIVKIISGRHLNNSSSGTRSCGCLSKEAVKQLKNYGGNTKHGLSKTKVHKAWLHMKERCYNPNNKDYKNYGGRGIRVCDEWLDKETGFMNFYNWSLDHGYIEGNKEISIDRENVNGNYCPENCRWVDKYVQANNKRSNIIVTLYEESLTLADASRKYDYLGLGYTLLLSRISDHGWDAVKAFTTEKRAW